jgi:hypothetical protein
MGTRLPVHPIHRSGSTRQRGQLTGISRSGDEYQGMTPCVAQTVSGRLIQARDPIATLPPMSRPAGAPQKDGCGCGVAPFMSIVKDPDVMSASSKSSWSTDAPRKLTTFTFPLFLKSYDAVRTRIRVLRKPLSGSLLVFDHPPQRALRKGRRNTRDRPPGKPRQVVVSTSLGQRPSMFGRDSNPCPRFRLQSLLGSSRLSVAWPTPVRPR